MRILLLNYELMKSLSPLNKYLGFLLIPFVYLSSSSISYGIMVVAALFDVILNHRLHEINDMLFIRSFPISISEYHLSIYLSEFIAFAASVLLWCSVYVIDFLTLTRMQINLGYSILLSLIGYLSFVTIKNVLHALISSKRWPKFIAIFNSFFLVSTYSLFHKDPIIPYGLGLMVTILMLLINTILITTKPEVR